MMTLRLQYIDLVVRPTRDDGRPRAFRPGEVARVRGVEGVFIVGPDRITLRFHSADGLEAAISRVGSEILAILREGEGGGAR